MPEIKKISSTKIKDWLKRETSPISIQIDTKAEKLRDEILKILESLTDVCKILLEKSEKEIEKRRNKTYGRAKALNKLSRVFLDRIQKIEVPNKVSYDSFQNFIQEMQRAVLVSEVDIRKWFPRISPFFIFDIILSTSGPTQSSAL